ncbi:preprotein translocase subunit SecA (plasmid) [Streptomyces sp. Qhu-G9]|uniref:preprotein translocase subunit SecA n=1 Tax=Streptomyces sp. Qhu-G9 TaxID=3452799 RepID=UPI0022AC7AFB|nr:preprotein translocase subunit SecA [Streptomyces aurantiacus]WAU78411.1 preprotein translocase subunit SecA [Streptomyces aurantiacus]WAU78420.1 preprotein translocase subunit SecA [Streptomyces aurantiacus]
MGSRTKRRESRNKRHRRSVSGTPVLDPHAQVIADSLITMTTLMASFTGDDPASEADAAFTAAIEEFVVEVPRFDAIRLIEVARQQFLPMAREGEIPVTAEAGAVYVELLALIALTARQETGTAAASDAGFQEMSHFVSSAKKGLSKVLYLAQLRSFARADPTDKLAMVSLFIRGAEVWMRNPSYPEMVEETNLALLDGVESVRAALQAQLGFDATDAVAVLDACHDLQQDRLNDRIETMGNAVLDAMAAEEEGRADRHLTEQAMLSVTSMFEPPAEQATVTIDDIVAHTSLAEECVRAVVERFRLDLGTDSPMDVVEAFTSGRNPLRTRPLIVGADGRLMLPHPALNVFAVRENLEEHLKKTAPVWSQYAKHRGDLLESRTHAALERVLPGARFRDGLEYYLPASEDEAKAADPSKYTKRAEGDHLIVLDDVAIIVEDKAVALSALSRGGKTARIRTDLTGIITKAAEQAGRMRDAIERDGGLRSKNEGWIDLSQIREIHTIAVSLDDISTVLTATAELVRAGLLAAGNIPWTVSLHDLELITELVARPAEFLLYLRRRRNPDVTVMFRAPDEMDLFLYFFEAGLWVEPDPVQVRAAFPFLPEPATAELRRYRTRKPAFLTSRTDALDQWFHTQGGDGARSALAPKPAMVPSPLAPLVDELQSRNVTGWLSIGATLLSGATDVQRKFARHGDELLDNPSPKGRSLTVPLTASVDPAEGWLFVWATRPAGADPDETDRRLRDYLRAKKHQLGLPRGVVFLYDQPTRELLDICYEGHTGPLDAALTASLSSLRPPSELHRSIHPNAKRPQSGTRNAARHKRKR